MNKEQAIKQVKELLPIYKLNKSEADSYKKISDKYNAQIKALMSENNLQEVITDDIKAVYSVQHRQEFDEEALIAKIKKLKVSGIIKKKEYVDMDALENAIYNGLLNAAELSSCQITKDVGTLRLSVVK